MSDKKTRFTLLTMCIVSSLHSNEPQPRGTEWEGAEGSAAAREGEALVAAGFASSSKPAVNIKSSNLAPEVDTDAKLTAILAGTVAEITDALEGLDASELKRIAKLEAKGKGRQGVADAIAEYDLG